MDRSIVEIAQEVLNRTEGGLTIIQSLYPQANRKHHFKLRDERTPSCSLHRMKDGNYVIKDFGSNAPAKNAIQLYAEENGLSFAEATLSLASAYHIETGENKTKNEAKFKKIDQTEWSEDIEFDSTGFAFQTKDFTKEELQVLGPFVPAEVCKKYSLFSIKWYAVKKEGQITIVEPTDTFPIFIFSFEEKEKRFYKILQPKSEDKKWRFFWKGEKPEDFIGGLSVLKKEMSKRKANEVASMEDSHTGEVEKAEKIDRVFMCSGERDAMNMASLGYFVLWQNSETAELNSQQYKEIMQNCEELYNIPDLDDTGKRQGHALAMKYLDIKTLWLPKWLQYRKDWRGNPRKDLCDLFELKRHEYKGKTDKQIKMLIENAYPMRFWDTEEDKSGKVRHNINNVHTFNFLFRNGFSRLNVEEDNMGYKFIRIKEHTVEEIKSIEVKDFINEFLKNRNIHTSIRNTVYNTTRLNDNQIANLPRVDLDFTDYTKNSQMLFFSHECWEITKNGITPFSENKKGRYVWDKDIINNIIEKEYSIHIDAKHIKIEDDYFKITKENGDFDILIKEENCEYLNFLIQTSRVHWHEELVTSWNEEDDAKREQYWQGNLFNICGSRLTEEQQFEQKHHLINKIFTLGYLLHRYKHPAKAWAVYAMENNVIDDDESHGGSGKSIFLKTPGIMMNWKIIDARNTRLWENNHLFDGVTEHTDYILFDDADKYFKLTNLYSSITGPLSVNPKNNKPFTIPFKSAPKFGVASNFSLRNTDPSTTRRLLFTALGDYYHEKSDTFPTKRDPMDDFGHSLFTDWKEVQWNKFFNLMAQCIRFYLSCDEKINPPMDQVNLRNLQSFMGVTFIEWADYYLYNNLNTDFSKREAMENLQKNHSALSAITSHQFSKRVKAWCDYNGYIYMPESKCDSQGRIQKTGSDGKREDFLYILSEDIQEEDTEKLPF